MILVIGTPQKGATNLWKPPYRASCLELPNGLVFSAGTGCGVIIGLLLLSGSVAASWGLLGECPTLARGPSAQDLKTLVPETMQSMAFGTDTRWALLHFRLRLEEFKISRSGPPRRVAGKRWAKAFVIPWASTSPTT